MQFTRAPYEVLDPLIHEPCDGFNAGQYNSAYVNVGRYHRESLMFSVGHMDAAATITVEIYEATSAAGAGAALIAGKVLNIADDVDDNELHTISVRNEELTPGAAYVQVRVTVAGGHVELQYALYGLCADYEPVPVTWYGQIVP